MQGSGGTVSPSGGSITTGPACGLNRGGAQASFRSTVSDTEVETLQVTHLQLNIKILFDSLHKKSLVVSVPKASKTKNGKRLVQQIFVEYRFSLPWGAHGKHCYIAFPGRRKNVSFRRISGKRSIVSLGPNAILGRCLSRCCFSRKRHDWNGSGKLL